MLKKLFLILTFLSMFFVTPFIDAAEVQKTGDLSSTKFTIQVCKFSPGGCDLIDTGGNAKKTIENTLKKTIERLIIALGTISLLIMIIGAGLMILYTGEDERLTNGKTIFTSGLIAVAIALLSGLMVQLVAFLLYI